MICAAARFPLYTGGVILRQFPAAMTTGPFRRTAAAYGRSARRCPTRDTVNAESSPLCGPRVGRVSSGCPCSAGHSGGERAYEPGPWFRARCPRERDVGPAAAESDEEQGARNERPSTRSVGTGSERPEASGPRRGVRLTVSASSPRHAVARGRVRSRPAPAPNATVGGGPRRYVSVSRRSLGNSAGCPRARSLMRPPLPRPTARPSYFPPLPPSPLFSSSPPLPGIPRMPGRGPEQLVPARCRAVTAASSGPAAKRPILTAR
ncbi:hypothetical protein BJY27_001085 [Streptomyces rapamycinicus]|uniref:XRE family transcriptional regulator n=2 Tax=Streptomyces rapamycinicus TaxID=1226757 RepID=A0A3L8R6F6_STRRN|nr:hypothetical protein [Streptomyces rapamycinicus]RLV75221.1 XRE family transcriptional regulator [Streptomyces rapamycinicus NRRL 5491]